MTMLLDFTVKEKDADNIRNFFEIIGFINQRIYYYGYEKTLTNYDELREYLKKLCGHYNLNYSEKGVLNDIYEMSVLIDDKFMSILYDKL